MYYSALPCEHLKKNNCSITQGDATKHPAPPVGGATAKHRRLMLDFVKGRL